MWHSALIYFIKSNRNPAAHRYMPFLDSGIKSTVVKQKSAYDA